MIRFYQTLFLAGMIGLVLILGGCGLSANIEAAKANPDNAGDVRKELAQIVDTDLDQAIARATAVNNTISLQCWMALKKEIADLNAKGGGIGPSAGVFSAMEQAIEIRQRLGSGVSDNITIGCSPLLVMVLRAGLKDTAKPLIGLLSGGAGIALPGL